MRDLIERQAAIEAIDCVNEWEVIGITVVDKDDVIRQINILPTIEERKKGKWIETDSYEPCWFKCDQCGRLSDIKEIYCPTCGASMVNTTCGADMRGEGHE